MKLKPIKKTHNYDGISVLWYHCLKCDHTIRNDKMEKGTIWKYCCECGCEIDWGDE